MIKKNGNSFEKHPVLTIVFVNMFFIFAWLGIDLIYSNFISSFTHTYEVFKSVKPIGHANVENKKFRWMSRRGEFDAEVKLNNLGFRNNEDFNEETIKDKKIIFAIGDSTTAAFENSYEASYPKVLNDVLGNDTIVFNTGVRGFDTNQVIINYETRLRKLKPDALIYMICENDLRGNINPELYPNIMRYYGKGIVEDDGSFRFLEPVEGMQRIKINTKIFLAKNLQLSFKFIYEPITSFINKQSRKSHSNINNDFDAEQLEKLEELLIVLNNIAKEDNIKLYITWFPYLKYSEEENTTIPQYYEKTKNFVNEKLENSVFIPTYEPLLNYYQNHPSTKETTFLFPSDLHATDFGSVKLSNIIGNSLKKN